MLVELHPDGTFTVKGTTNALQPKMGTVLKREPDEALHVGMLGTKYIINPEGQLLCLTCKDPHRVPAANLFRALTVNGQFPTFEIVED
jgi:hypothetical protein